MFDPLLEQDPWVKSIQARTAAEAHKKGELNALRGILSNITQDRFPALTELVEEVAVQTTEPAILNMLTRQVALADSEERARRVLSRVLPSSH